MYSWSAILRSLPTLEFFFDIVFVFCDSVHRLISSSNRTWPRNHNAPKNHIWVHYSVQIIAPISINHQTNQYISSLLQQVNIWERWLFKNIQQRLIVQCSSMNTKLSSFQLGILFINLDKSKQSHILLKLIANMPWNI